MNEKIISHALMNAEEIQGVLDAVKSGTVSASGLLVIRNDIKLMIRQYEDYIQYGDNQAKFFPMKCIVMRLSPN